MAIRAAAKPPAGLAKASSARPFLLAAILLVSSSLAFIPRGKRLPALLLRQSGPVLHTGALCAGSGLSYDADPSRMEQAAAFARGDEAGQLARSQSQPPIGRSTGNSASLIPKDVVVIGSGLAGLAAALRLSTTTDRHVTLLDREDPTEQMSRTTAGSFAAAGMLAPQSERLPTGPLLDLCLQSRELYTDFVGQVEGLARNCGAEGKSYLWRGDGSDGNVDGGGSGDSGGDSVRPWEVGYSASGGFLAPAFAGDSVATWAPPDRSGTVRWLDAVQVRELEPQLHPDVVGGWWFPEDASVDSRRLTCSLRAACVASGVHFMHGTECEVTSLELSGGQCRGVRLADGRTLVPKSVLVANGAWMRDLLPVPIVPHKGQSFSVRMPPDSPPLLSRVLFAQDTYIVPKADGRIVVGATVEAGSFDPSVTPAGLMHCMTNAVHLVPALANLPMEETWAGLRPTTPDKGPILGGTPWNNLFIAGGYWRNGVLLAPKTGQLMGDLIAGTITEEDEALIGAFTWDRFTNEGGGDKLAADARYAASMHPVHSRSTGMGISAAVGTELGFYSGAADAGEERARDRSSLFGDAGAEADMEDAFERAAMMGKDDATAFSFGGDAPTVGVGRSKEPLPDPYVIEDGDKMDFKSPDAAGASIIDSLYDQFNDQIKAVKEEASASGDLISVEPALESYGPENAEEYNETTYDGYQAILKDDWGATEEDLREKMRQSRIQNRMKTSAIDESKIGAIRAPEEVIAALEEDEKGDIPEIQSSSEAVEAKIDLSSIYEQIKANKEAAAADIEMEDKAADDRPDPDFRIYRVDSETGEEEEVPPYTKFQEVEVSIASRKREEGKDPQETTSTEATIDDLSSVYEQIKANKEKEKEEGRVEMQEAPLDVRPDPGFRIHRVDSETGEAREMPPYTSPGEMEDKIAKDSAEVSMDD